MRWIILAYAKYRTLKTVRLLKSMKKFTVDGIPVLKALMSDDRVILVSFLTVHLMCISWTSETYMQSKIYFVVIKSHWVLNGMMVSGHCPFPNCCILLYVIVSSVIGLLVYMHFATLLAIECSFNESSLHITSFPFGTKASKALGISACLM